MAEIQSYSALAAGKISSELKGFTGGLKERAISKFAAETLIHFCEESASFAEVVYKTRRTLSDCCAEVMRNTGNYVSDIDVYRGIVRAYFPNADVKFLMNIEIGGAAPSEEEMARLPEKPKPAPKAKQQKAALASPKVPATPPNPMPKPTPVKEDKPKQPEIIQLSLF